MKTITSAFEKRFFLGALVPSVLLGVGLQVAPAGTPTYLDDFLEFKENSSTDHVRLWFDDQSGSNADYFYFRQSAGGDWIWDYGSTPTKSMELTFDSILKIYEYDTTPDATIILNAGDPGSSVSPSIVIDGNAVLTGATGVLRPADNDGSDDSLLLEGTFGGSGTIPETGWGTRMMWYPEKAAFRAGHLDNGSYATNWDDANVGDYSAAFGLNTKASGDYSFAAGQTSSATGQHSAAFGHSTASGDYSAAFGGSTASGLRATAMGVSSATGDNSTAMGYSIAYGDNSTAMGTFAWADASHATAMGYGWALGSYSAAMGSAVARGDFSAAVGDTEITSYGSTAVGVHNEDLHDKTDSTTIAAAKTAWQGDDEHSVFEVGIGTSTTRKNALTVFQDGSVDVGKATDNTVPLKVLADGSICIGRVQGDVSMGVFGN